MYFCAVSIWHRPSLYIVRPLYIALWPHATVVDFCSTFASIHCPLYGSETAQLSYSLRTQHWSYTVHGNTCMHIGSTLGHAQYSWWSWVVAYWCSWEQELLWKWCCSHACIHITGGDSLSCTCAVCNNAALLTNSYVVAFNLLLMVCNERSIMKFNMRWAYTVSARERSKSPWTRVDVTSTPFWKSHTVG